MGIETNVMRTQLEELNQLMETYAIAARTAAPANHGRFEDVAYDTEVWHHALRFWSVYTTLPLETKDVLKRILDEMGGDDQHELSECIFDYFDVIFADIEQMIKLLKFIQGEIMIFGIDS